MDQLEEAKKIAIKVQDDMHNLGTPISVVHIADALIMLVNEIMELTKATSLPDEADSGLCSRAEFNARAYLIVEKIYQEYLKAAATYQTNWEERGHKWGIMCGRLVKEMESK